MAYTTIDNPELYFQTKLYAGTGSAQSVTFDGSEDMQPDWVWGKGRDVANLHALFDSVRGTGKALYTDRTNAEENQAQGVTAFNSDGFSMGTLGDLNASSKNFVAWNWKAGGSASSNSNGSITSSVSANTTAGFSIVKYTGTGSNATVGHGLGAVAKMIIFKVLDSATDWRVYHVGAGNTGALDLNSTDAIQTNSVFFQDTTPTSSVFSIGTGSDVNTSSQSHIAYCFSDVKGYSKFGSYTGNGNADGTFVYTGFRPAWVITKNIGSSHSWWILDNKRDALNPTNGRLVAEESNVEDSAGNSHDFLSNGFKLRTSGSADVNGSGDTMVYMAFAESPFVNSSGIPCNAR